MPRQFRWFPRPRSWSVLVDVVPAFIAAMECSFGTFRVADQLQLPGRLPLFFGIGGVVAGSVLLLRRRHPLAVALFAMLLATLGVGGTFTFPVAMYTLAAYGRSRRVLIAVVTMAILAIVSTSSIPFGVVLAGGLSQASFFQLGGVMVALLSVVAPLVMAVLLGLYVVTRSHLIATLQERADQLEREQALLAQRAEILEREQALLAERTRIARDMHDVVAHRVSLMVVHAGAVETVAAKDPESAADGAHLVGDMGRQALDELRQVLGVLRRSGDTEVERRQPALEGIATLVEQSRTAGVDVVLDVRGQPRPVGMMSAYTVYRVVQEALTNVHKHAGNTRAEVMLDYLPEALEVVVENSPAKRPPTMTLPSSGHGLVGMRERINALGGTFSAGATGDGGFRVAVTLPYGASSAADVPPSEGLGEQALRAGSGPGRTD